MGLVCVHILDGCWFSWGLCECMLIRPSTCSVQCGFSLSLFCNYLMLLRVKLCVRLILSFTWDYHESVWFGFSRMHLLLQFSFAGLIGVLVPGVYWPHSASSV